MQKRQTGKVKQDFLELLREQPELYEQIKDYLLAGEKLVLERESNLVQLDSANYLTIDTDVLTKVQDNINDADYKKLISLGKYLKTRFNILFNHTKPFTLETLSNTLGINKENTTKFVKRMVSQGLMAYTVCAPTGFVQKLYAINPQLIRRGKCYDQEFLDTFFRDFSK